jgi:hypothetical protein
MLKTLPGLVSLGLYMLVEKERRQTWKVNIIGTFWSETSTSVAFNLKR